jgi:hypothetical protein
MNIPTFPDESHIGRKNIENFMKTGSKKNVHGPVFGWTYNIKRKIEDFRRKRRDNPAFDNAMTSLEIIAILCAVVTVAIVFAIYKYYSITQP